LANGEKINGNGHSSGEGLNRKHQWLKSFY